WSAARSNVVAIMSGLHGRSARLPPARRRAPPRSLRACAAARRPRAARGRATRPARAAARADHSLRELPVVGVGAEHLDELLARSVQPPFHGAERRVGDV